MNEPTTDKMESIAHNIFPGQGKTYEADFGDWCLLLYFVSEAQAIITSKTTGDEEAVSINILPIRLGLFLVHWQEEDGTVVAQVQDYSNNTVFTCTTLHRAVLCRQGRFREVQP